MLLLSKRILPSVAVSRPINTFAKVDFPQPDSPTIANVSLSLASKDSVSFALTVLYVPLDPNNALAATS